MKALKTLFVGILAIIIAIGGSGCMKSLDSINNIDPVAYLNSKYPDDTFSPDESFGGKLFGGESQKKFLCKSDLFSEAPITVIYDKNDDQYYDNYADIKYAKDVDERIKSILDSSLNGLHYFCLPYAYIIDDGTAFNFDANNSLSDFLENRGITAIAYVQCNDENLDVYKDQIESVVCESGVFFERIEIYFINNYDSALETDSSVRTSIAVKEEYTNLLTITMSGINTITDAYWEK